MLITGAGTGMGRAAAIRLAREGAQVILVGRRRESIGQVVDEISQFGGHALAIACDVSNEPSVISMVADVRARFETLDGVFANAGVLGEIKPLADTDVADLNAMFDSNVRGTFLTIKHCLPMLDGGSLLINASWTAAGVMPGVGSYAASKGALLALMRTLAVEQGARNVRVNAINPGIILTPMADMLSPPVAARLAAHTPLLRNGTPEDVSGTVAWLLSEDAAFVTGQEINVDGGFTLGGIRF